MIVIVSLLWQLLVGQVTYYGPGIMEGVYETRLAGRTAYAVSPCPVCVGMIAVENCTVIGKYAYLTRPGQPQEGAFLIVDCGRFVTPGRIAEVDYATARSWQMYAPIEDVQLLIVDKLPVTDATLLCKATRVAMCFA